MSVEAWPCTELASSTRWCTNDLACRRHKSIDLAFVHGRDGVRQALQVAAQGQQLQALDVPLGPSDRVLGERDRPVPVRFLLGGCLGLSSSVGLTGWGGVRRPAQATCCAMTFRLNKRLACFLSA